MKGRSVRKLIDRSLLVRSLAVLGATEAVMALGAFALVLLAGGWRWGSTPSDHLLFVASGSAFATIAVCQMANAFACRSSVQPVWEMSLLGNKLVLAAVAAELVLLVLFLGVPGLAHLLGGGWPSPLGWLAAAVAGVALVLVDGAAKHARRRSQRDLRLP
jgi:magnesium-transporting ATPase (P-type)